MNRRSGRLSPVAPPDTGSRRRRRRGGSAAGGADGNRRDREPRRSQRRPLWAKALLAMLRNSRATAKIAGVFLALTMASLLIWSNVHTNALAVYSDGERVLYVQYADGLSAETITDDTLTRMAQLHGTEVRLTGELTVRPTNSGARLSYSEAIETLAQELDFNLIGTAIVLGGRTVAVLPTEADAREVFWILQEPYLQLGTEYYSVDFVENVQLVPQVADAPDTVAEAVAVLGRRTEFMDEHIVQPSENLGSIAILYGTTVLQILEDNTQLNAQSILHVGDRVQIRGYRPYLSVRTVEETVSVEPIPIEERELENPAMPAGHMLILEEGAEGEREVTTRITRVNGIQLGEPEPVSYELIHEMSPRIIEVGVN